MMLWICGAILVVAVFFWLRKKQTEGSGQQSPQVVPAHGQFEDVADDNLLAVLMAAIAEFEGTSNFKVLQIRASGNWKITARQELLHGRL
jgi:hypothetical protein